MYGNEIKEVTVMSFGFGGVGKSAFGNAFLQRKVFIESDEPDSCTLQTSSQFSIINGTKRHYIDTQGLKSTDGLDGSHIQQMVQFLKNWKIGINAFFILINIQCPRFDEGTKKMMIMLNDFFNNPDIWNHTGIVRPEYKEVKEEILSGVLVGSETQMLNGQKVQFIRRQNQKRIKYTHWNGNVTYSKPEVLYEYTVTQYPDNSKQLVLCNFGSSNYVIQGDIIV